MYLNPTYYFKYSSTYVNVTETLPLCSSQDNYFIPLFAGIDGSKLEHNNNKALLYNIRQSSSNILNFPKSFTKLIDIIHLGSQYCSFKDDTTNQVYYTMKHFIYVIKEGNIIPLYCLCFSRDDIFSINRELIDFNKFFLIISNELFKPEHKSLSLKIKSLIKFFTGLGSNVIYTDNATNLYLKVDSEKIKFSDINERIKYINNIKKISGLYYDKTIVKESIAKSTNESISEPRPKPVARESTAAPDFSIFEL